MAFVYEINGQRVEFDREPTERDIDEAARSLKPAPESARPKPVEGAGGAAFGVYPQAGRRPESQQDREAAKEMPLQTARGVASNVPAVAGIPGTVVNTLANLPRTAQDIQNRYQRAVSGSEAPLPALPEYNQVTPYDMAYFGQLIPGGEPTSPAGQLAFAGGQALGAPVMTRTIQGAAQVPGRVMNTARELRTGVTEGLRNPTYQSNATTAFQPLKETYYPTPEVQRFQAMPEAQRPGALPALEASQQPSASLFQSPGQLLARNMAPTAAGETLVPLQGRTARAFGEQIARDVSNRPLTAGGIELGGAALGALVGGPIGAIAGATLAPGLRFAQLAALNKLSQTAGFAPGFTEQLAAARGRAGIQAGMPTTPALGYTPPGGGGGGAAGPVNPATMYAGAGGVSPDLAQAGAAALNVKYPPAAAADPAAAVREAAAARVATSPTQNLATTAQGQQIAAILEQRRAAELAAKQQRWAQNGAYTPPAVEAPTVAPVTPAEAPAPAAPAAQTTLDQLRSRLQPQTPEQIAAVEAYNAKTPAEKAAQTRAETAARKAPPGVSNMLTTDPMDSWRSLNTRVETLPDGATVKRYPWNESKTIRVEEFDKSNPYGVNRDVVYRHEKTDSNYVERYRGARDNPELMDRELYLPDVTLLQRFATEMTESGPRRTDQLTVQKGAKKDVYVDGKYSHSYDGRGSLKTAPQFGAMPDMDSLIRKFKDQ